MRLVSWVGFRALQGLIILVFGPFYYGARYLDNMGFWATLQGLALGILCLVNLGLIVSLYL